MVTIDMRNRNSRANTSQKTTFQEHSAEHRVHWTRNGSIVGVAGKGASRISYHKSEHKRTQITKLRNLALYSLNSAFNSWPPTLIGGVAAIQFTSLQHLFPLSLKAERHSPSMKAYILVQRGTIHAWYNEGTEWARMYAFMLGENLFAFRLSSIRC